MSFLSNISNAFMLSNLMNDYKHFISSATISFCNFLYLFDRFAQNVKLFVYKIDEKRLKHFLTLENRIEVMHW